MSHKIKAYEFQIDIEKKELDIWAENIKFSVRDSIHQLYPKAIIEFLDAFGLIQERSFIVDGTSINMSYSFNKEKIVCPYNVISDENVDALTSSYIAGNVKINLLHNFNWIEKINSKVYKNKKISEIITEIFSTYQFNKKTIIETDNKNNWYQPLVRECEFINNILLPNAFSPKCNDTPYFCFINSNNELNFTTYNEMISHSNTIDLVISPQDRKVSPNLNILSLNRYITGNDITNPIYYMKDFEISSSDGQIIENNYKLIDYPRTFPIITRNEPPKQIPVKNNGELYKSYLMLPSAITAGQRDNNKGRSLYRQSNGFFLDRMHIILPLNLKLIAGKTVTLNLVTSNKEKSSRFNGNYIIENSEHIWNGHEGITIIDIGRKNIKVPTRYEGYNNVWGRH
jgi:hypothetical protein